MKKNIFILLTILCVSMNNYAQELMVLPSGQLPIIEVKTAKYNKNNGEIKTNLKKVLDVPEVVISASLSNDKQYVFAYSKSNVYRINIETNKTDQIPFKWIIDGDEKKVVSSFLLSKYFNSSEMFFIETITTYSETNKSNSDPNNLPETLTFTGGATIKEINQKTLKKVDFNSKEIVYQSEFELHKPYIIDGISPVPSLKSELLLIATANLELDNTFKVIIYNLKKNTILKTIHIDLNPYLSENTGYANFIFTTFTNSDILLKISYDSKLDGEKDVERTKWAYEAIYSLENVDKPIKKSFKKGKAAEAHELTYPNQKSVWKYNYSKPLRLEDHINKIELPDYPERPSGKQKKKDRIEFEQKVNNWNVQIDSIKKLNETIIQKNLEIDKRNFKIEEKRNDYYFIEIYSDENLNNLVFKFKGAMNVRRIPENKILVEYYSGTQETYDLASKKLLKSTKKKTLLDDF